MAKNLLITGATGKQGGAVISALLASRSAADFQIYAVTRNPSSSAATALASKANVQVIKGDLDDPESLFKAAGVNIWGVYSVQVPMGKGQTPVTEERQGKQLVDAALAHGHVKKFVYTSADRGGAKSSSDPTNIPHFISKFRIEKHLQEKVQGSNIDYSIFRPVAFMENFTNDFPGKAFSLKHLHTLLACTLYWRARLHLCCPSLCNSKLSNTWIVMWSCMHWCWLHIS